MADTQRESSPRRKLRGDLIAFIVGLALVGGSAWLKYAEQQRELVADVAEELLPRIPRPQLRSHRLELPTHTFFIMSEPVTARQFAAFVQETGYQTWRERQGTQPTWRDGTDSLEPVLWVVREDCEAFCQWLSARAAMPTAYPLKGGEIAWHHQGFRLPHVLEIEQLHPHSNVWEWTADTLATVQPGRKGAAAYLTAWREGNTLHRRQIDMSRHDAEAVAFRVAWSATAADLAAMEEHEQQTGNP